MWPRKLINNLILSRLRIKVFERPLFLFSREKPRDALFFENTGFSLSLIKVSRFLKGFILPQNNERFTRLSGFYGLENFWSNSIGNRCCRKIMLSRDDHKENVFEKIRKVMLDLCFFWDFLALAWNLMYFLHVVKMVGSMKCGGAKERRDAFSADSKSSKSNILQVQAQLMYAMYLNYKRQNCNFTMFLSYWLQTTFNDH